MVSDSDSFGCWGEFVVVEVAVVVGHGWLCVEVYVTMSIEASVLHLSTCFLAEQPLDVLHL